MSLRTNQAAWEDLGRLDPLWAISTQQGTKHNRWKLNEFFASGKRQVREIVSNAASLGLLQNRGSALDFGCGVGRLTAALSEAFSKAIGIDISAPMIARARELCPACDFIVNTSNDLPLSSASVDLVLTLIVLQHTDRSSIFGYLSEFSRVLKPKGTLIFQLPSHMPWRHALQPRRRVYSLLRALRVNSERLYALGLQPMRMTAVSVKDIASFLNRSGIEVLRAIPDNMAHESLRSVTYYCLKN